MGVSLSDLGGGLSHTDFFLIYLFIYFWLCWVFVSVRGLALVGASGGHSSSRCAGLSLSRSLLLRSTGSRRTDSVVVAHRLSCSAACGIFPDQGLNPCPLHWQADSQPLRHQGSPRPLLLRSTGSRRTGGMWDLPRPGLKPVSPALAGRFSTTAPPGKPATLIFLNASILINH